MDDLRNKIQERNKQIEDLQKDIVNYQQQVETTGKEAKTLTGAVQKLELTEKKLTTDIKVTENKIVATALTIEKLGLEIGDKEKTIARREEVLRQSLRTLQRMQQDSELENLFLYNDLGEMWETISSTAQFQDQVRVDMDELRTLRTELTTNKQAKEGQKRNLQAQRGELSDKKKITELTKAEKAELLKETKNRETLYKKTLAEKTTLRDAVAKELLQFESELRLQIDPKSVPQAGTTILAWPLGAPFLTQQFGHTDFSRANARLYNGNGHNGVDFRASIGTPLLASASGKIVAVGDTDTVCPGASYGKWVMVEHPFGLSTLYAHLSLIKVSNGQQVVVGDLLGYSGDTGYATGPHLHFTVYATQGVQVVNRKSLVCKGTYVMPVADLRAYLDPMQYLPKL